MKLTVNSFHNIALLHYDVTSKQYVVQTQRIMSFLWGGEEDQCEFTMKGKAYVINNAPGFLASIIIIIHAKILYLPQFDQYLYAWILFSCPWDRLSLHQPKSTEITNSCTVNNIYNKHFGFHCETSLRMIFVENFLLQFIDWNFYITPLSTTYCGFGVF